MQSSHRNPAVRPSVTSRRSPASFPRVFNDAFVVVRGRVGIFIIFSSIRGTRDSSKCYVVEKSGYMVLSSLGSEVTRIRSVKTVHGIFIQLYLPRRRKPFRLDTVVDRRLRTTLERIYLRRKRSLAGNKDSTCIFYDKTRTRFHECLKYTTRLATNLQHFRREIRSIIHYAETLIVRPVTYSGHFWLLLVVYKRP